MFIKSTSPLQSVSFSKKPRIGQQAVFDAVRRWDTRLLKTNLPTGYGKTIVCCGTYSILANNDKANRLLIIFPTDSQLEQFKQSGAVDLQEMAAPEPLVIMDLRYFGVQALKAHRQNGASVFLTTIQSIIQRAGRDLVESLLSSGGRWMLCVDEYHHYAATKEWGRTVLSLPVEFTLAMSATPKRKDNDSAFGEPDIVMTYKDAMDEKAVKPLMAHSYVYRLDLVNEDGEIQTMTTDELLREAGGDSPAAVDQLLITRKMRWSPQYISPLVRFPLERMIQQRLETGYELQAIVGAMSVSHAEMVCAQINTMFGDVLTVDWVGTGEDGRAQNTNKEILQRFCPPKDPITGKRIPSLDVLVHVGMAGEGLDSVNVSEVIHLNAARWNNSNDQENGRAARFLPGVIGHISFDSSSEYAQKGYLGSKIMDAFDHLPPTDNGDEDSRHEVSDVSDDHEYKILPDEPTILIEQLELDHIDSGTPGVVRMKHVLVNLVREFEAGDIDDPSHCIHDKAITAYKTMLRKEAEKVNPESTIRQWKERVKLATAKVTGLALSVLYSSIEPVDNGLSGKIKKRINAQKKLEIGAIACDEATCRQHYAWLKELETKLMNREVPQWLH